MGRWAVMLCLFALLGACSREEDLYSRDVAYCLYYELWDEDDPELYRIWHNQRSQDHCQKSPRGTRYRHFNPGWCGKPTPEPEVKGFDDALELCELWSTHNP